MRMLTMETPRTLQLYASSLLFSSLLFSSLFTIFFSFIPYILIFLLFLLSFLPFCGTGVAVMDVFSAMASASLAVFSGLDFMHMQHKVEEAQKKEDDRLGEQVNEFIYII